MFSFIFTYHYIPPSTALLICIYVYISGARSSCVVKFREKDKNLMQVNFQALQGLSDHSEKIKTQGKKKISLVKIMLINYAM